MSGEPSSKRAKTETTSQTSSDNAKQNDGQMPVSAVQVQANPPDIFKLDVDCCEEIFEWLSIKDLHSFGQTCKRMNRIAGKYFQQNYSNAHIRSREDGGIEYVHTNLDGFSEFIENIEFDSTFVTLSILFDSSDSPFWNKEHCSPVNEYAYIGANCKSLKTINIAYPHHFKTEGFHLMREIFTKVETLDFGRGEFNGGILDLCPNLKRLRGYITEDQFHDLFTLNKCPKLELIRLPWCKRVERMSGFLDQLSNIQNLEIVCDVLLENKVEFLSASVKFDNLSIELDFDMFDGRRVPDFCFTEFCSILNELYDRGFYKRLHFTSFGICCMGFKQIASICALESLEMVENESPRASFDQDVYNLVMPVMPNLKKISIDTSYSEMDTATVPMQLPNLEQISFGRDTSMEQILPFIRWSKKLSQITCERAVA